MRPNDLQCSIKINKNKINKLALKEKQTLQLYCSNPVVCTVA